MAAIVPSLPSSKLHQIPTSNRPLRDIVDDSIRVLQQANTPPSVFCQGNNLTSVVENESGDAMLRTLTEPGLRLHLSRIADYWKLNSQQEARHAIPPKEAVQSILAGDASAWGMPALVGITEIPTFRPDGTLIEQAGYDASTAMIYRPGRLSVPPIPDDITDLGPAIAVIDNVFGDFPFADQASKANLYALLLTPILRPLISGCTPLCLIDAPEKGTGKTLLAQTVALITTGRETLQTVPRDETELRKKLFAALKAGSNFLILDNVEGVMKAPELSQILTSYEFEDRILGTSEQARVRNVATWVATGNNLRTAGDIQRRCYHIRLDAKGETRGRTFRHQNLREYVKQHRGAILQALNILCTAWLRSDRPKPVKPLESFESWHQTVGGVLYYAGIDGFLGNQDSLMADEDEGQWEEFLREWHDRQGDRLFGAHDLLVFVKGHIPLLPDSIADIDLRNDAIGARSLTNALSKRRDRRMGAMSIQRQEGKSARFVVRCGAPAPAQPG
jgi:hypothetical protein